MQCPLKMLKDSKGEETSTEPFGANAWESIQCDTANLGQRAQGFLREMDDAVIKCPVTRYHQLEYVAYLDCPDENYYRKRRDVLDRRGIYSSGSVVFECVFLFRRL